MARREGKFKTDADQLKAAERRFADGLEDQRRILETISVSTRDRATVQKLLTRMEAHYYALIRERDEKLRALTLSESDARLRLDVLERVAAAAELKQRIELQTLEGSAATADNEMRALRRELAAARAFSTGVHADVQAAVLALGAELARVESSEVEVRQVLGFVRQSNLLKDKKLEVVERHNAELLQGNAHLAAALAEKSALERRFNERNARLQSTEARHKAALASSNREMARLRKENEELRAQAERELFFARAAREELLLAHEQLRMFAAQRDALVASHARHHAAENRALRVRLRQLAHAMDKAMLRDDVVLRTGGGYMTLPEFLTHLMQVAGPPPDDDDDGRAHASMSSSGGEAARTAPVGVPPAGSAGVGRAAPPESDV